MGKTCLVPSCKISKKNNVKVMLHTLPKDPQQRFLWLQALELQEYAETFEKLKHFPAVCSNHFGDSSYEIKKVLKLDAVPQRQNDPQPFYCQTHEDNEPTHSKETQTQSEYFHLQFHRPTLPADEEPKNKWTEECSVVKEVSSMNETAVKVEVKESSDFGSVCFMCLSTDRWTYGVDSVSYAYGLMTDWAPQRGARVCWECRAALVRLLRLKVQALRARELLDATAHSLNTAETLSGCCMSQLSAHTISEYAYSFSYGGDDSPPAPDAGSPLVCKEEPDADGECVSECEVWAEAAVPIVEFDVPIVNDAPSETQEPTPPKKNPAPSTSKADDVDVGADVKKKRKVGKRKEDTIEMFSVTPEELDYYRRNVFNQMRASKYTCTDCMEGFKYEGNLKRHNELSHSEKAGAHACDVCRCRFASASELEQHRRWHYLLFRCREPGCRFAHHKSRIVRQHHSLHHLRQESEAKRRIDEVFRMSDKFQCDYCGKEFPQRRQVMVHIKHHFKKIMCEVCGHKCSTLSQLRKHRLAHLDPSYRPHECTECHKRFIDRHKLLLHTRTHTGERPFKCDACAAEFVSKEVLTRHTRYRHSAPAAGGEKRKFSQARTKSYFINRRHVPGEEQRPLNARRDYKVDKDAQNKFECNVCNKKLSTLAGLRTHFYIHSDKKPLTCEECNKTFKYHSQLQVHISQVHKGEKPHQCNVCGARFASKTVLQVHMSSHSKEKPFKCDECNVTFKYKAGLWSHKLIHKGEKPHQCNICGSRFTLRGNLVGHMKTHTNERPFECNVCGRKFPWKRNLRNHFKTHVKEQQMLQMQ